MKNLTPIVILSLASILGFTSCCTSATTLESEPIATVLKSLPSAFPSHSAGQIRYQFTCDYYNFQPNGDFESKDRVSATYSLNTSTHTATWSDVTIASATNMDDSFGTGEPQTYMDGFSYNLSGIDDEFSPSFFKGFPDKMEAKSLVWDTLQLNVFGTSFLSHLKLDVPYKPTLPDAHFPGGGFFHNRQAEITWIGVSNVDGKLCAQLDYDAPFNPLQFVTSGITLNGMSNYHGLISVNLSDGMIERGTIEEEVVGSVIPLQAPANFAPIITHTIRHCIFQRL